MCVCVAVVAVAVALGMFTLLLYFLSSGVNFKISSRVSVPSVCVYSISLVLG